MGTQRRDLSCMGTCLHKRHTGGPAVKSMYCFHFYTTCPESTLEMDLLLPMHTQCIPNAYPLHAYHFMNGCCSSIVVYQVTSNNRCVTSTGSHKQCHTCLSSPVPCPLSPVRCLLSPVTQPKLSVNMMCGVHVLLCFSALQC